MNSWSCLFDCFRYLFDVSEQELLEKLGHDGSQIIWPNLPDPLCRRAFHPQEFIRVGLEYGIAVIGIERTSYSAPTYEAEPMARNFLPPLHYYLEHFDGVLTGTCLTRDVRHAVIWKNRSLIDPVNVCKSVDKFDPEMFWITKK